MSENDYKISIDIDEKKLSAQIKKAFEKSLKEPKAKLPSTKSPSTKPDKSKSEELKKKREEKKRNDYIFNETKRQLKRTKNLDTARSIALHKSKQTEEERRRLTLNEQESDIKLGSSKSKDGGKNSFIGKQLSIIAKNTKLSKFALGSIIGNAVSAGASGILSFLKQSAKRNENLGKSKGSNSVIYGKEYETLKRSVFRKYSSAEGAGYINEEKQQEILSQGGRLKSTLTGLGQGHQLEKYIGEIARLVSSGAYEVADAFEIIDTALRGDFSSVVSEAQKFGTDYNYEAVRFLGESGIGSAERLEHLDKVLKDIKAEEITNSKSGVAELDASKTFQLAIDSADKVISKATQNLGPIISGVSKLVDQFAGGKGFFDILKDAIIQAFTAVWGNIFSSLQSLANSVIARLPSWLGGGGGKDETGREP